MNKIPTEEKLNSKGEIIKDKNKLLVEDNILDLVSEYNESI